MAFVSFIPPKIRRDLMRNRDMGGRDWIKVENKVLDSYGVLGYPITVEGVRYSKVYHPTAAVDDIRVELEEKGYFIPAKFDTWAGVMRWVKPRIHDYPVVYVPHLQASRKWGRKSSIVCYSGRRGFIGLERNAAYSICLAFFREIVDNQ